MTTTKAYRQRIAAELKPGRVALRAATEEALRAAGQASMALVACPRCGGPVERREGTTQLFHVGTRVCPAVGRKTG